MHILSPETDNCPSWISGRERMTVENISWSISTKECCRPRRGLNPRPPGLQSDGASNWATEAGDPGESKVQQQGLHALAEWESKWGVEFHPQKCSVLGVWRACSSIKDPYKLKEHTLETEEATKYLSGPTDNFILEEPYWQNLQEGQQHGWV